MAKIKLYCFIILISFMINNATKLNYPRVLLPIFDKISTNFTLEVIEKGCFKWTSSRQDLILITPQYEDFDNECSYQATVTVLSRERRRNTAIVIAEDVTTGEILRCDVILDVIDSLGVHTTTRQLFLEEAPETFELRAEDSQGNAFTTLEGIEFNWVISSLNSDSKHWSPALRFLTFTESPYHEVPRELEKFEAQGIKGYMVLLEGINTGTAKVTVSFPYPEYKHVPAIEVYINVLANIILEPSELYMLVGDTVNFRILQLKMGKLQEISLNNQYFLEIQDDKIAHIDVNSARAKKIGQTSVVLRDRNAPNDGNFGADESVTQPSIPSAIITVIEPYKIGVSLLPYKNWMTVKGEKHVIAFDLYTREGNKITLGSKYAISSEIDQTMFYISKKNVNGSCLSGEAVKEGTTPVYGFYKDLSVQAELQIFSELVLSPQKVILPFDPNVVKTQKIQFHASGGDGSYIWHSPNSRAIQITQNGLATTVISDADIRHTFDLYDAGSLLTAHTHIRVALMQNPKISRQAEIYFLPPVKLEILKYNFETALKDYVHIHLGIYAYVNNSFVPYTNCENLLFDLEFSNQIFHLDNNLATDVIADGACQVLHLRSTAIGLTNLRISYKFRDNVLKDEATLHVFEKFTVLNPIENEIVLPIGASRNIIFENGPQRIFTLDSELTKNLKYDTKIATVQEITDARSQNPIHGFTVLCRKVGQTKFNFEIYNVLSTHNFMSYISNIETVVNCVKPRFLNLYATEKLRDSCPLELKNSLLHLKERNEKFDIEIEVQDAKNRKLMNISSLHMEWKFMDGEEQLKREMVKYQRQSEEEIIAGIRIPVRDLLLITLTAASMNLRIKGLVVRYDENVLAAYGIYPELPNFGIQSSRTGEITAPVIENEIRFMAVNSTLFAFEHISIFMAKDQCERIPIAQGSGHYIIKLSEPDIVNVKYDNKNRQLVITPLRFGHVHLELTDRCLMTEPAHLSISVVSIGVIRVHVPDRVERTKSIEAIVRLYDSYDNLLQIDSNNLEIYDLSHIVFNPEILSVKLGDQHDLGQGEIRYIVTGNKIGETKIVYSAGVDASLVSSEPTNIQVFPPLRLYPRNSTLVVGSSVHIYYKGGPQPDPNIVYRVHEKNVISMEYALVSALKLGKTNITGSCLLINALTGKETIISQDTIEVHVVPLTNIQIKTPLTRIRTGAVMPAAVWGVPDLSPIILGSLEHMRVTWTTNLPDVIHIYNIFAEAGIDYDVEDMISVRIKALNPGKANIKVEVELSNGQKISTKVEIIVFKTLELESPKHIRMDWILMAPRSTIQLKASVNDAHYKLDTESNGAVKVTPDGVVRSFETLGRDLIIAKTFDQNLPIGIEVKNVQYILATLDYPTIKLKQTEQKIPRGMNFVLKVSLHDNLGNEFSHSIEDTNGIRYELSHKDDVDVQIGNNLTISIYLPRETSNMISISLKDATGVKHAEDYIKLSVADSKQIYPIKTIFSVGDIICFDSPLTLSSYWTSSDEKILTIDKFTGVAKVLGNGFKMGEKIVVTNHDKASDSLLKYDVEVRDGDVIEFLKTFDIFSGAAYRAHLVVRNHLQSDKDTNLIAKNASICANGLEKIVVKLFTCRLTSKQALGQQLLSYYKITPIFDADTGRYACQIDLISSFNEVLSVVKTNDVNFDLEAQLANGLMDSISLKFVPGIRVTPDTFFASDLINQELTITGLDKVLQKVEVRPSNEKLLKVIQNVKSHGTLQYKIKMLNELPLDEQLFIGIHSPATQQNIDIPVLPSNAVQLKCSAQPFESSWDFLLRLLSNFGLIITAVAVLGVTLWIFVYFTDKGALTLNQEAFASSPIKTTPIAAVSPVSPPISPTFVQRSPQTPLYGGQSPYNTDYRYSLDSQVYGNATITSPIKRINRRYM